MKTKGAKIIEGARGRKAVVRIGKRLQAEIDLPDQGKAPRPRSDSVITELDLLRDRIGAGASVCQ